MRRVLVVLAATAAALLAACGESDEDRVRDVARAYMSSVGNRQYTQACDQLASSAKRDIALFVSEYLLELRTTRCEDVLKHAVSLSDEKALESLRMIEIDRVTLSGDKATAEFKRRDDTATLAKIEGDWKISQLDFLNAANGAFR